jgi:hypothetical protein
LLSPTLKSVSSPVGAQNRKPNISSRNNQPEQHELEQKPSPPTTASLFLRILIRFIRILAVIFRCAGSTTGRVQVLGFDLDDVVVIGQLASFGGETEVGDSWEFDVRDVEAGCPFVFFFVHELDFQGLFGEVGYAGFGGDVCVAETACLWYLLVWETGEEGVEEKTYRTASEFVGLAVVGLVIGSVSITLHSHDIGKHNTRSVVLVRVEEDTQTLEFILVAKHGTLLCSVGCHPHGEAITEEVALAIDVEFNLDLPVRGG